jgi:CBS domain-containing protein
MTTKTVRDIMSRDLVYVTVEARASLALPQILRFGITAVPVLDPQHRPIGIVSLRDLVAGAELEAAMTTPARVISQDATIEEAARALAAADIHHFVVVGTDGRAVGMVSSLDLLRSVLDLPVRHPAALREDKATPRHAH